MTLADIDRLATAVSKVREGLLLGTAALVSGDPDSALTEYTTAADLLRDTIEDAALVAA